MYILWERITWLIESDVSIVSKSKELKINSAKRIYQLLISLAFVLAVKVRSIRKEMIVRSNVDS